MHVIAEMFLVDSRCGEYSWKPEMSEITLRVIARASLIIERDQQ